MQKALFLDRDGVVNVDKNYVHKIEDFEPIEKNLELIKEILDKDNYLVFIITNQAGIARGYYTEEEFLEFEQFVEQFLLKKGITVTKTYYCPHHPTEAKIKKYSKNCECRKPMPGMILEAAKEFALDLTKSIFIGDSQTDEQAAKKAGITFIKV